MEPSEKVEPRKRQVEGWRQVARRRAEVSRRTRKGVGLRTRALLKAR